MLCTIEFLQEVFPDKKGKVNETNPIEGIMTDSRKHLNNALFIPIIGDRFDAHHFIEQAKAQGAIATLWNKTHPIPEELAGELVFFIVEDTTEALQSLASAYREKVDPLVIGITGSNGKTTTKDLLHAVLQKKFSTYATKGNFNNDIGLPLTILQMEAKTEVLILEMGMSGFGEIDLLTQIARPDYAVITNIGESHIEHLGTRAGIAKAKLEITNGLKPKGLLVIDGDEPLLTTEKQSDHVFCCGFNDANDAVISDVKVTQEHTTFTWNGMERYTIPLLGVHHALNASYVIALANELGMKQSEIQAGMMTLDHSAMRFERIIGKNKVTIINDAYNASPTSMKGAINVIKEFAEFKHKVVVLGDILELGDLSATMHQSIAEVIEPPIDVVYTYGSATEIITTTLKKKYPKMDVQHFVNETDFKSALVAKANEDTIILFKASRGMAFEEHIEALI